MRNKICFSSYVYINVVVKQRQISNIYQNLINHEPFSTYPPVCHFTGFFN